MKMGKLKNFELISIDTQKMQAIVSFQNEDNQSNINNGYDFLVVPIKLRPIQYSAMGNMLINQSIKSEDLNESGN